MSLLGCVLQVQAPKLSEDSDVQKIKKPLTEFFSGWVQSLIYDIQQIKYPRLALMTEAEPCSGRVQMTQECGPSVSLPSLSSHIIFVHLDIDADIDVLMLIVKSRWLADADLESILKLWVVHS